VRRIDVLVPFKRGVLSWVEERLGENTVVLGERENVEIIKKAITHKGLAIVDILHPCVSFNNVNTYAWYREHTYWMEDGPFDRETAFRRAVEADPLPLGVFYVSEEPAFEENVPTYRKDKTPLWKREPKLDLVERFFEGKEG